MTTVEKFDFGVVKPGDKLWVGPVGGDVKAIKSEGLRDTQTAYLIFFHTTTRRVAGGTIAKSKPVIRVQKDGAMWGGGLSLTGKEVSHQPRERDDA